MNSEVVHSNKQRPTQNLEKTNIATFYTQTNTKQTRQNQNLQNQARIYTTINNPPPPQKDKFSPNSTNLYTQINNLLVTFQMAEN